MPLIHVRPRPLGDDPNEVVRVRDPQTAQLLPPEGVAVEWSTFWQKRKEDGDLVVDEPAEAGRETSPTLSASRPRKASPPSNDPASADSKD